MLITVTRTSKTIDSYFGNLMIDTNPFKCVTLENVATLIPSNIVFDVLFMWSNHFQQIMPHIIVPAIPSANLPKRIAIEIHWANVVKNPDPTKPDELDGCTALGTTTELSADCIDQSKIAWIEFVQVITDQPSIKIIYKEDYGPVATV